MCQSLIGHHGIRIVFLKANQRLTPGKSESEEYLAVERSVGEGCFFCRLRDILRGFFSVKGMLFEWSSGGCQLGEVPGLLEDGLGGGR